eukprot:TRINITY_DN24553_c0_g1_i1.p1 TRINITY_DN24553_c0_g1~~TRINITY_DN24553_c0_g1_i1.p1  ORF type:complete len:588 (+),score=158.78 TRINITY_DN24553_c0_g1_i1:76-1839(+)
MDPSEKAYLQENVGSVLSKALAEMTIAQPKDGVDFLAKWLHSYVADQTAKSTQEQEEAALAEERALTRAKIEEQEETRKQKLAEVQHLESLYIDLLDKFSDPETRFEDKHWQDLIHVSQATCEATATYLAVLEPGEEGGFPGPYLSYEYASEKAKDMIERTLPQGVGTTWGALTENPAEESFKELCLWKPPSVEPVPEEPVEGEEPPPAKPGNPYYPVLVNCVTDEKAVHYFEITRLGAYLAIPLVFPSYCTLDAYADAKVFQDQRRAEALKRAEVEAARAAAAEAGELPEGGEPEAPVEEKQMVLRGTDVKMVLCMDTLGSNTCFDEAKVMKVLELVKACGQCKSQTEFKQVDEQVLTVIDTELRAQHEQQIADAAAAVDERMAEQIEAEEAECPDERKDVLHKKNAFRKALEIAKDLQKLISALSNWVVAAPELMSVISAAAFMAGFTREEIYPRRKTVLEWAKLKTFLARPLDLIARLEKVKYEGPRKGLLPDQMQRFFRSLATPTVADAPMDADKAKEISPAFMLIFNLVQAALAYRAADLEMRRAEFTKQKEEAVARLDSPEEYDGPRLEDLDDDFKEPPAA